MKREKLIENLEDILINLKNMNTDDIKVWAYDSNDGCWIFMDGEFKLNNNNTLDDLEFSFILKK